MSLDPELRIALRDRLLAECKFLNGCLIWTGATERFDYGVFNFRGQRYVTHRIAYELFNGYRTDKNVLHSCDVPRCFHPLHLREGTQAENMRDMAKRGRSTRGSKNPRAKLTEDRVIEIRQVLATGKTCREVGEQFNISRNAISAIRNGYSWKHI